MPVLNGERYLAEAIESILSQTFADFELIIVDDGSDDRSAEIIRSFQERDGRIQFIQLEDNMGPATARNCGIFASCGEYVTFMDCDDISLRERLEKQASFLDSHPQIGAVGICVQLVNRDLSTRIAEVNLPQTALSHRARYVCWRRICICHHHGATRVSDIRWRI